MNQIISTAISVLIFATCTGQGPTAGKAPGSISPEMLAQIREVDQLATQAKALMLRGRTLEALAVLRIAGDKEDLIPGQPASKRMDLVSLLVSLNRKGEALVVYKEAFKWDPRRNDLTINGPDPVQAAMDYAVLLAESGRLIDAKAIYYYGLRCLNSSVNPSRDVEPVPFVTVFDEEPEGVAWELTTTNLKAAASMARLTHAASDSAYAEYQRIRVLAPDWFYPVVWYGMGPEEHYIAEAEALAKPGVERELMRRFREDLTEHKRLNQINDTPGALDERPMIEGNARRSRMACLRPNPNLLRQLSVAKVR